MHSLRRYQNAWRAALLISFAACTIYSRAGAQEDTTITGSTIQSSYVATAPPDFPGIAPMEIPAVPYAHADAQQDMIHALAEERSVRFAPVSNGSTGKPGVRWTLRLESGSNALRT